MIKSADVYTRRLHELYKYAAMTPPHPPALSLCFAMGVLPLSTMFVVLFVLVPYRYSEEESMMRIAFC